MSSAHPGATRRQGVRLRRGLGLAVLVVSGSGCYAYTPLATTPVPDSVVSFALTDAGRIALGRNIGDGARSLEAEVDAVTDSGYVLRVQSVTYVSGQTNKWTGEHLVVNRPYVTDARLRTFSKSRTAMVATAAVGGIVAFIITRGLVGGGSEVEKGPGTPSEGQ